MAATLYERLGGRERIQAIMSDVVDLHLRNPVIRTRFAKSDVAALKRHGTEFFVTGSGGPGSYQGRDMRTAHAGMNISEQEFMAALDDILTALEKHRVGQAEKNEVLGILYSMRGEIVRG
jgi:hemoglobin